MDQLGGISENWPTTDLARGQGNVIEDGLRDGVYVTEGASPAITGNTLARNAWDSIEVAEGAHPRIGQNATTG